MKIEKNLIIYSTFFLILISSSIKQPSNFTPMFDRFFTGASGTISSLSTPLIFISFLLLSVLIWKQAINERSLFKIPSLVVYFFIFKLLIFFSLFFNGGEIDFKYLISALILLLISYSIVATIKELDENSFIYLSKTIFIFTMFFVFLNVYQIISDPQNTIWAGRLYGLTNHPNYLGGYLAMLTPFLLYIFFSTKQTTYRISALITTIFLIYLVLGSGSRSSVAVLILGIAIWFFIAFSAKKSLLSILLISFLSFLFFTYLINTNNEEINFARLTLMQNTREYVIHEMWSVFIENPIFGNPLAVQSTSSSYLGILANTGIIGGAVMLFMLIHLFINSYIKFQKNTIYATQLASISVFLLDAMFEGLMTENFSLGQVLFVILLTYFGVQVKGRLDVKS